MSGFSPALMAYLQKLDKADPLLVLLDIAVPDQLPLRLVANNENIEYQGNTYEAFNFVVDKPGADGKGAITTLPLKIANAQRVLRPYLDAYDGGVGLPVTMTIINPAMADEDYSELTATLYNLATDSDSAWVYFTLGPYNPRNKQCPPDQYLATSCRFDFVDDPRCGYSGPATTCSRTLDNCRVLGNSRRFGGFPGLSNRSLRLV